MKKYMEILSNTPLFQGISYEDIPVLLEKLGGKVSKYHKNEYIKLTGDPVDFMGIVLTGTIQILQDDYYGNRSITATFGKGALFAESFACMGMKSLPVDILSCDDTHILFMRCQNLFTAWGGECKFHHTLITNLLKIVARKNMVLTEKIQCISHKTTGEKLMAYLNNQAKLHRSAEFTIPFDRQSLADYLGVERSAMSAEISKLAKLGILETKRSHFKLLRPFP